MKTRNLFGFATIAGLVMMLGGSVIPASADGSYRDVRQDRKEVRQDVRNIRHDRTDVRQDRKQVGKLNGSLRYDVNHNKFGKAKQVAKKINRDRHDIKVDRTDVRKDNKDLRHDLRDIRQDR